MTISLSPRILARMTAVAMIPVLAALTAVIWIAGAPTPASMETISVEGLARVEAMAADLAARGVIRDDITYVVRDLGFGDGGSVAGNTDWAVPGVVWIDDETAEWWNDERLAYVITHEQRHLMQAETYEVAGDGVGAAVRRLWLEHRLDDMYGGNGVERQADCATQAALGYGDRSASTHACTGEALAEAQRLL